MTSQKIATNVANLHLTATCHVIWRFFQLLTLIFSVSSMKISSRAPLRKKKLRKFHEKPPEKHRMCFCFKPPGWKIEKSNSLVICDPTKKIESLPGFALSSLETTLKNWRNPESPRDNTNSNLLGWFYHVTVGAYGGPRLLGRKKKIVRGKQFPVQISQQKTGFLLIPLFDSSLISKAHGRHYRSPTSVHGSVFKMRFLVWKIEQDEIFHMENLKKKNTKLIFFQGIWKEGLKNRISYLKKKTSSLVG